MNLDEVKAILKSNNDFCSLYYLGLFCDEKYCSLLRSIMDNTSSIDEITKTLIDEGWTIHIFQNCLEMLKTDPIHICNKWRWLLPNEIQFPFIPLQTKGQDTFDKFFFSLKYEEVSECFEETNARISIKSNIYNCRELLQQFETDTPNVVFLLKTEGIFAEYKEEQPITNYFKRIEIKHLLYGENTAVIFGEESGLNDIYELLRRYTYSLYEKAYVINRLSQLTNALQTLPTVYQHSLINKYVPIEENELLLNLGIKQIAELSKIDVVSIGKGFVDNLYELFMKEQYGYPVDIVLTVLKKLKQKQSEVVIARYFGDKVETLESIGAQYGQTRELIRQVEKKATTKLILYRGEWKRLGKELYYLSQYEHFITRDELQELNIPISLFAFLSKVTPNFIWDETLGILIFSGSEDCVNKCLERIDSLPSVIVAEEYQTFINNTQDIVPKQEIRYLLEQFYTCHGAVYSRNRLKMGDVISFIMDTYFPNGISLYDDDAIRLFREKAREHFNGFEFADKDRAVRARMQDFCVPIGRGIWKLDKHEMLIPVSLQRRIEQYIENYKISVVPITAVFLAFSEEFVAVGIENRYHLQGQLKLLLQNKYTLTRDYILKGADSNLYNMVEDYVKQSTKLITKQDIIAEFPGITEVTIGQISQATGVMNMNGYYVHIDNLNLTDNDITNLKEAIDSVLVDDSIYHTKTIYNVCKTRMEGLFSRIGLNHYLQLYYLIHELFPNDYEFNRPYIAILGVEVIGAEAQLVAKIAPRDITTIAEIREFAKQVGMIIDRYIPFIDRNNDTFVFMNENAVVSLEYLEVSEDLFNGLDVVLSEFIGLESYRPLNEFFDYWKLPQLKIPWSEWLLYSIVNKYSSEYSVRVSSNVLAEAVPILVADTFDDSESDFSEIKKVKLDIQDEVLDMLDIDDLIGGDDLE